VSLGDVAIDIWQNGGQVVVLGAGGVVIAAWRRIPREVDRRERLVREMNEDLRRWVHDRDRELQTELALITAYANDPDQEGPFVDQLIALHKPVPEELKHLPAGSQYYSGAHLNWRKAAKERALHEWRDRATASLRSFDELTEGEGRFHAWWRRRRPDPRLRLTPEGVFVLERWREPATIPGTTDSTPLDDPTSVEREPRVRALEAGTA
jgi:hypothetical protein